MTNQEALKILAAMRDGCQDKAREAVLRNMGEHAEMFNSKVVALNMALDALEATCKPENRPNGKRKTDRGVFIPESPKDAEMDDLREVIGNIKDDVQALQHRVNRLEAEVAKLWQL